MKNYIKQTLQPMRPYVPGEDLEAQFVSVWGGDTPEVGGMIAENPKDPADKWYVSKPFFEQNYAPAEESFTKSLGNTDQNTCRSNVKDVVMFGDDLFKLLSKASSREEGWMKSTKAMETPMGCVVQVTTQQIHPDGTSAVAEALTFVPGAKVEVETDREGNVTGRYLTV